MRVGIVAKHESDRAVEVAGTLARALLDDGSVAVVDETTRAALAATSDETESVPDGVPVEDLSACDLAVSVGGDGTFLFTARGAAATPLLGVNVGEVGFLNAVDPADAVEVTRSTVARLRETEAPDLMSVPRIVAAGSDWTLEPAVNEVAIQGTRRGHGGGLDVTVRVDGDRFTAGHADGVLVATPIGSTAYSLSEGGPLVHHDVGGLVVTPMAGEGLRPPTVVREGAEVTVEVADAAEAVAVGDGRVRQSLSPPTGVTVGRGAEPLRIAEPSLDFFGALDKLD